MSYDAIRAAIENRIATEMAASPTYPVSYQNVPFTPPNNTPWLQVFIRFGDNNYATLKTINRQTGTLVVNVFTPKGQGAALAFGIGERIRALFDRLTLSGIIFDAPSGPAQVVAGVIETGVSASSGLASAYYQTQLTVTFEAYLD